MKKGMAQVNGTTLYYEVMGKGLPLVRFWQPTEPPASERLSEIRAPC
jgi:hypothetical protein